jgi:hypothetical protein
LNAIFIAGLAIILFNSNKDICNVKIINAKARALNITCANVMVSMNDKLTKQLNIIGITMAIPVMVIIASFTFFIIV